MLPSACHQGSASPAAQSWTALLTRTVTWDLLCTVWSQAQSNTECTKYWGCSQPVDIVGSTESHSTSQTPRPWFPHPQQCSPTAESLGAEGAAGAQRSPLASPTCQTRHLHCIRGKTFQLLTRRLLCRASGIGQGLPELGKSAVSMSSSAPMSQYKPASDQDPGMVAHLLLRFPAQ